MNILTVLKHLSLLNTIPYPHSCFAPSSLVSSIVGIILRLALSCCCPCRQQYIPLILNFWHYHCRTIKITSVGSSAQSLQTDSDGRGCVYLTRGSYSASVKLSQAADEAGMRWVPCFLILSLIFYIVYVIVITIMIFVGGEFTSIPIRRNKNIKKR